MTRLASAKSMLSDLAISRIAHVDVPRVSRKKLNASAAGTEVAAESDTGFVGADGFGLRVARRAMLSTNSLEVGLNDFDHILSGFFGGFGVPRHVIPNMVSIRLLIAPLAAAKRCNTSAHCSSSFRPRNTLSSCPMTFFVRFTKSKFSFERKSNWLVAILDVLQCPHASINNLEHRDAGSASPRKGRQSCANTIFSSGCLTTAFCGVMPCKDYKMRKQSLRNSPKIRLTNFLQCML